MFYSDTTRRNALRVIQELPTNDILQIVKSGMGPNASKYLIKETNNSVQIDMQNHEKNQSKSTEQAMKFRRLPEEGAGRYKPDEFFGEHSKIGDSGGGTRRNQKSVNEKTGFSYGSGPAKHDAPKSQRSDMSRAQTAMYNQFVAPISSDGEQPGNVTNE